jgi:hypothetical protein
MSTTKAKAQARKTSTAAKKTADQAERTTRQAERTLRTVVRDGVYAYVGVTDTAIELLKSLPNRASELRTDAPREVRGNLRTLRVRGEQEFDELAERGRAVVTAISRSRSTQRALEQTRNARRQVKGAATSVRKAVNASAEAVEDAAEKVGDQAS